MFIPTRTNSGGSIARALAINAAPDAFARASNTSRRHRMSTGRMKRRPHMNPIWPGRHPHETGPGNVAMGPIMSYLESVLPEDAIMTNGAGQLCHLGASFPSLPALCARRPPQPPAPWAMACRQRWPQSSCYPERMVVCFAGDGCFLMNGQDFATAVKYGLPIIVRRRSTTTSMARSACIRSGNIPGRVSATDLTNPDFAMLARAYGGHGETVADHRRIRRCLAARGGER